MKLRHCLFVFSTTDCGWTSHHISNPTPASVCTGCVLFIQEDCVCARASPCVCPPIETPPRHIRSSFHTNQSAVMGLRRGHGSRQTTTSDGRFECCFRAGFHGTRVHMSHNTHTYTVFTQTQRDVLRWRYSVWRCVQTHHCLPRVFKQKSASVGTKGHCSCITGTCLKSTWTMTRAMSVWSWHHATNTDVQQVSPTLVCEHSIKM